MPAGRSVVTASLAVFELTSSCTTSGRSPGRWVEASPQLTEVIRKQEIGVWEALKKKAPQKNSWVDSGSGSFPSE